MHIALIAKPKHEDTGVGKYVKRLKEELEQLGHRASLVHPVVPLPEWFLRLVRRWIGWDLEAFFNNYPVWARYTEADIYHITSQNLATLMFFRQPPGRVVITTHDLIPWLVRDDPRLRIYRYWIEAFFDRMALRGLQKADGIITDSDHTAHILEAHTPKSNQIVKTIMLGIN